MNTWLSCDAAAGAASSRMLCTAAACFRCSSSSLAVVVVDALAVVVVCVQHYHLSPSKTTKSLKTEPSIKREKYWLYSLQSTRVEMANRKRQAYQNEAKNLCSLLFVFDLDGECKFIKNTTISLVKKYVLGCHLGWMNRRFCIRKGGSFFQHASPCFRNQLPVSLHQPCTISLFPTDLFLHLSLVFLY